MDRAPRERRGGAFFGRRVGKPLSLRQSELLQAGMGRYGLDIRQAMPADLHDLFAAPVSRVRLEIGFGAGEHLRHAAAREPQTGFIGIEPFVNSLAKMLTALEAAPSDNLRLYGDDAVGLLDLLPAGSLDGIDLLYPDPWPKRRHWKRRFVGRDNLDSFDRLLKPGGIFRFASDVDSYVNWTLQHVAAHPLLAWTATCADDWRTPFLEWPGTRYEEKARREGRATAYLTFKRE